MGSVPYPVARLVGRACDAICTPLGIRPPLTRMAVDITGRDLDVDNTLAKGDLGWKTRITYQEALQRIGVWVMDRYLKGM